jgi:plasmid maintenance system antidote protein VapI
MAEAIERKNGGGDTVSWLAMQASYDLKTLPTRAEIEQRVRHHAAA